jgi:hypothetical protein
MHITPLNEIKPTLAYHRVNETWEPWGPQTGFLYTAAVLTCGCCGAIISGMGGPGGPDWMCISCYHAKIKSV